jgi:hypothetical protein
MENGRNMGKLIALPLIIALALSLGCKPRTTISIPPPEETETRTHEFPPSRSRVFAIAGEVQVPVWAEQGVEADILTSPADARVDFSLGETKSAEDIKDVQSRLNAFAESDQFERVGTGGLSGFRRRASEMEGRMHTAYLLTRGSYVVEVTLRWPAGDEAQAEADTLARWIIHTIRPAGEGQPIAAR